MTERTWLQLAGLVALTVLAGAVLYLIGHTVDHAVSHMSADGKVPVADAGLTPALVLSFREVVGLIGRLWDHQANAELTDALSNSTPTMTPNPPAQQEQAA